jgi:choline-sulfatase
MTGRMPVETGVIGNDRAINPACPTLGQWLRRYDYETVYTGKWHLPEGYTDKIDGFDVLPVGNGQGDLVDGVVSRSSQAYLADRGGNKPFLLISSLLQPHDICYWAIQNEQLVPKDLPFSQLAGQLPPLPPNHTARPKAPLVLDNCRFTVFNDLQWQYYIYTYYRQVEMLDAEVGRILDAIELYGHTDNTIVIFTSDHGEGLGRHLNVQKWHPYDESMKVPMVVSCPSRIAAGRRDTTHLVSGLDVMSTVCDYANIAPPPDARGLSLRNLLENKPVQWREYIAADTNFSGRILRTDRYKYVTYPNDPIEQLFDMKADPWETVNLCDDPRYADVVRSHRNLLNEWQSHLKPIEPSPIAQG